MTTPDVREYVDLTVLDRDPLSIFLAAQAAVSVAFPDWDPNDETDMVNVLLQALAVEVSEVVFACNRTPSKLTEVLLRLFGITPDVGLQPTAEVTFTVSDALGHVIPAGTRVRLNFAGDAPPCDFLTDEPLVIAAAATTGTVDATAEEFSTRAHSAPAGTPLEVVDAIFFVESAELATQPTGGAAPESTQDYLNRGAVALSRLVSTLVLPEHFTAAALDYAAVVRATTIDNYDPATGPDPGDNAGHVTVAVLGAAGATLSAPQKDELEALLEAQALVNLDVHIVDPDVTDVAVTVTVTRLAGYESADVEASIEAALDAYLDPDVWDWDATVRVNELIVLVDAVPGVDYVETLTITGGAPNLSLTGDAPLVDFDLAGTTITVNAP